MKLIKSSIVLFIASLVFFQSCKENFIAPTYSLSTYARNFEGEPAMDWMVLLCKIIANESRYNPPKASRIYAYTCINLYESVVNGMPGHLSLAGQLNQMPAMPKPDDELIYDWPSVLAGSMPVAIKGILVNAYSNSIASINALRDSQIVQRKRIVSSDVVDRSVLYGETVANKILDWSSTDGYAQTRGLPYTPPPRSQNPANWEPINPGDTAEEPYWGTLRPFAMPTPNACDIPPTFPFDTTIGSLFYNDQLEIKNLRSGLTQEQKNIALFWRDKQLTPTPPGHWVYIAAQMVTKLNLRLDKTSEMFALVGIAVGDAFISAWEAKYHYNYLRPQSYIRDYIQPGWTPYLPTPPFSDYPSGHSTESGSSAYVLTQLFGTVAFTDTTHISIGMAARYFNSFYDAADECSDSRQYGGIHYRDACETGVLRGKLIGQVIFQRVRLRIY